MRAWTVSEVKAGTLTQCLGIARQFDPEPKRIVVEKKLPSWKRGILSPYRGRIEKPEPDLLVACGSMSPRHVQAIARAAGKVPMKVYLQRPNPEVVPIFDLIFVSRHDWTEDMASRPNFHQMLGVPHQIEASELQRIRPEARARWLGSRERAVAVLVGGPNDAYAYNPETIEELVRTIRSFAAGGWATLISTSRRSDPSILPRLLAETQDGILVWDRTGENPYRQFLAAADALLVTKDTVTMTCEAVVTGKPVYIFDLARKAGEKLAKFERFHNDMSNTLGLTRAFRGELVPYTYEPPQEAKRIAGLIAEARTSRLQDGGGTLAPSRVSA